MNKNLVFLLIMVFLFFQIGVVNSVLEIFKKPVSEPVGDSEVIKDETDISERFGLEEGQVTTKKVELQKYKKLEEENTRFTFVSEDSQVCVKENCFENIEPSGESLNFIELDENGEITEAKFTVDEQGGTYVFGDTEVIAPPNSRVLFDQETGITIRPIEGTKFTEVPESLNQPGLESYTTTIECIEKCKSFTLPNGAKVNGKLNFDKNGRAFVEADSAVTINNVEINTGFSDTNTNIFFDGARHEGKYVSFGKDNLIITSNQEKISVNSVVKFKQDNPFIRIDEGDHVAMQALPGGEIEIQNRDSKGLISRVVTKGDFIIDEDYKSILYKDDKVFLQKFSIFSNNKESSTSPIELFSLNQKGSNVFSSGDKLFVDNFNRIAIGPDVKDFIASKENFLTEFEGINTKFSSRIKYNYPSRESLEVLTGKKLIFNDVPKGSEDAVLGRLRDYWETLTPETKKSLKGINFLTQSELQKDYFHESIDIEAFSRGEDVFFGANNRFDLDTFRHEAAHLHSRSLLGFESKKRLLAIEKELIIQNNNLDELKITSENFDGRFNEIQARRWELNQEYRKLLSESDFNKKWVQISGDVYVGRDWEKVSDFKERGVVTKYATLNPSEDTSETIKKAATSPQFFESLINPSSSDYNPIYRQKLDLLHEYKFISNSEYNKILSVAGVQ